MTKIYWFMDAISFNVDILLKCYFGVLLKNTTIKQKVLDAHKELKKTNIKEVKKYLTKAGLVKIGSTAPVDVLKELYESAKLTGEVLNSNKETLLHNFINENNIE